MILPFTEKYRPKTLDEMIGIDIEKIRSLIKEPMGMPHMLFYSKSPGTGKSSLGYVIRNETNCQDFLKINVSDERRIDDARTRIREFAMTKRTNPEIPRILLLDEFDGMTLDAQKLLRSAMDDYIANCKFILTANYINKIIEPIQSRCTMIEMVNPNKIDITKRLTYICNKESITYTDEGLSKLIDISYPDMRNMIEQLQLHKKDGITIDNIRASKELCEELFNKIMVSNREARKYMIENDLDADVVLLYLMDKLPDQMLKPIADCSININNDKNADIHMNYLFWQIKKSTL